MRIVATFPGRFGDLLWSLPTVRAISEAAGMPVHLVIAGEYATLVPLLRLQPYLASVVADPLWVVQQTAPMTPIEPPIDSPCLKGATRIIHLGYPTWPDLPLPQYIWKTARLQGEVAPLDLDRPWLHPPPAHYSSHFPASVTIGFTDEHFELKYGLYMLLTRHVVDLKGGWQSLCGAPGSRWQTEGWHGVTMWEEAASRIAGSQVFLGCCSALHVLACALGVPVVMMEPAEARWHPIFFPYGKHGPRVTLVHGTDGRPTFDARHCRDTIRKVLSARYTDAPAREGATAP